MKKEYNAIKIPFFLWIRLHAQLREYGKNIRESGAFLLGYTENRKVIDFVCYHELDPDSSNFGAILFRSENYVKLWSICKQKNLNVIADLHTHPGKNTNQSEYDRKHPMLLQRNHIAIIIPNFAKKKIPLLKGIGIYEYRGDFIWEKYSIQSKKVVISIF
jgi:proteasome lid subunit RPN8/RPN11